jgi:hypothetical protein
MARPRCGRLHASPKDATRSQVARPSLVLMFTASTVLASATGVLTIIGGMDVHISETSQALLGLNLLAVPAGWSVAVVAVVRGLSWRWGVSRAVAVMAMTTGLPAAMLVAAVLAA